MKYSKQLETEKWQVKRRKILQRDKFKCVECGYENNLHVHHLYYVYDKMAWQYPNNALVTLCSKCHKKWHEENDLEFKTEICKKKYIPSSKRKISKEKKKKKVVIKPETKKDKQKRLAVTRLKENKLLKIEIINSSLIENKEFYLKKVDSYTIKQLKKILST